MRARSSVARPVVLLCILAAAACGTPRLTHLRRGWRNCHVDEGNNILCGGQQVATVECHAPRDEACGSLSIVYADGQRVFLSGWTPVGESTLPRQPPPQQIEEEDESALHPEIAGDGSAIWYARGGYGPRAGWKVFDPTTGMLSETDRTSILLLRNRVIEYYPLWRTR